MNSSLNSSTLENISSIVGGKQAQYAPLSVGSYVYILERRGDQTIQHNGTVIQLAMSDYLRGSKGEMAITAVMVNPFADPRAAGSSDWHNVLMRFADVRHTSHRDWIEGRAGLAYMEVPLSASSKGDDEEEEEELTGSEQGKIVPAQQAATLNQPPPPPPEDPALGPSTGIPNAMTQLPSKAQEPAVNITPTEPVGANT